MTASKRWTATQSSTGLKVALRIIRSWQATPQQACRILRISPATYRRISTNQVVGRRLDLDQLQRVGFVLGIHATLRTVFTNPENFQGYPRFKNDNEFFEGRSPLEIMAQGDMVSLYETYKRIEQLKALIWTSSA